MSCFVKNVRNFVRICAGNIFKLSSIWKKNPRFWKYIFFILFYFLFVLVKLSKSMLINVLVGRYSYSYITFSSNNIHTSKKVYKCNLFEPIYDKTMLPSRYVWSTASWCMVLQLNKCKWLSSKWLSVYWKFIKSERITFPLLVLQLGH